MKKRGLSGVKITLRNHNKRRNRSRNRPRPKIMTSRSNAANLHLKGAPRVPKHANNAAVVGLTVVSTIRSRNKHKKRPCRGH